MNRVYSDEKRMDLIARYKESGLPKARFARENGLSIITLSAWLNKELLKNGSSFVPVEIQKHPLNLFPKTPFEFEIAHSSGIRVSCSSAASVEWVAEFFRRLA